MLMARRRDRIISCITSCILPLVHLELLIGCEDVLRNKCYMPALMAAPVCWGATS